MKNLASPPRLTAWWIIGAALLLVLPRPAAAASVRTVALSNCVGDEDENGKNKGSSESSQAKSRAFQIQASAETTESSPSVKTHCDIDWVDILQDLDKSDANEVISFDLHDKSGGGAKATFQKDPIDPSTVSLMREATRNRRRLFLTEQDNDDGRRRLGKIDVNNEWNVDASLVYGWTGTNHETGGDANVIVQQRPDGTQAMFGSFTDLSAQRLCQFSVDANGKSVATCIDLTQENSNELEGLDEDDFEESSETDRRRRAMWEEDEEEEDMEDGKERDNDPKRRLNGHHVAGDHSVKSFSWGNRGSDSSSVKSANYVATSAPTSAGTLAPSVSGAPSASNQPSAAPMALPTTFSPTQPPSAAPTASPTQSPTTLAPSFSPTQSPTSFDDAYITRLDVMIVWTRRAECNYAGFTGKKLCHVTPRTQANMLGLIEQSIFESNVAFEESGVHARFNLVHAYRDGRYEESEASQDQIRLLLRDIQESGDKRKNKFGQNVHAKRAAFGADLVFLFAGRGTFCGAAAKGPNIEGMFGVVRAHCVAGRFTLAHEAGHLLGCKHDRGTHGECSEYLRKRNYGYRDPETTFRTIMAYDCKKAASECDGVVQGTCPRIQRFASDHIDYNGKPIGNRGAGCAGLLNKMKDRAAAFFPTTCFMGQMELSVMNEDDVTRPTFGQVFKIAAKEHKITITSFSILAKSRSELGTVEIWSLPGSYDESDVTNRPWKKIHSQTVMQVGRVGLTRMDCMMEDSYVTIPPGRAHSFYITFTQRDDMLYVEGTRDGKVFMEDKNIRIYEGKGFGGYGFSDVSSNYQRFTGAVQYFYSRKLKPRRRVTLDDVTSPPKLRANNNDDKNNITKIIRYG